MTQARTGHESADPTAPLPTLSEPTLLSEAGSTRATAYSQANKAVRVGSQTAVTWIDAVAKVRLAVFNHETEQWGPTQAIGEGHDNHTNPALTATPDGRLRIAYGPHGFGANWNQGRFMIRQSAAHAFDQWNDYNFDQLDDYSHPGYNGTYASLLTDAQGRDHLAYRGGPQPSACFYERFNEAAGWDRCVNLSAMAVRPRYTNVGSNLTIGLDGEIYCAFHYFSNSRRDGIISSGVCALKTADGGTSWTGLDGAPVTLPLEYDPALAIPHVGQDPRLGSLAIDAAGRLVAYTYDTHEAGARLSVYEAGQWRTVVLEDALPGGLLPYEGNVTVDAQGRVLVVVTAQPSGLEGGAKRWGHPTSECWLLTSTDGGHHFTAQPISPPDPTVPNWLPNISATGPNHDLNRPLIIYTQGGPGVGCSPTDCTKVYAVWVQ